MNILRLKHLFSAPLLFLTFILLIAHAKINAQSIEDILWTADWSHDGKYIAVGGNHGQLYFYSEHELQVLEKIPFDGTITKLKWHPTKNLLAIASQGTKEKLRLFNFQKMEFQPIASNSADGSRALGWNYTGQYLAAGDNEGFVWFYTSEGVFVKKVDFKLKSITGLSWHPHQNKLVAVSNQISIYDFESGEISSIKPRPEDVLMLCVEWHPSGDFFVTGDYGDYIFHYPALLQFWTATGNKIREIELSKAEYRNLRWSPDGKKLATASESLRIWSKKGKLLSTGISEYLLWGLDWNNSGSKLVTTSEKGIVEFWTDKAEAYYLTK